jgi:hypothetical protein
MYSSTLSNLILKVFFQVFSGLHLNWDFRKLTYIMRFFPKYMMRLFLLPQNKCSFEIKGPEKISENKEWRKTKKRTDIVSPPLNLHSKGNHQHTTKAHTPQWGYGRLCHSNDFGFNSLGQLSSKCNINMLQEDACSTTAVVKNHY